MTTKQVWKIGDCLNFMHDLADKSIDLILTDPPYGVNYSKWDSLLSLEWFYLSLVKAKTVAFTPGLMNMYRYPEPDCIIAIVRPGSIQHQKRGGGFSHWEPVLVYGEHLPNVDMVIVRAQTDDPNNGHPCPKSLEMYSWLVTKLSHEGETVLDPFTGSGTTLRACRDTNRNGIGYEINPEYEGIIKKRLMADTPSLETWCSGQDVA